MSTNTKRSAQLYGHLSPKQRAALACKYTAQGNEAERNLVYTATPRLTYWALEANFRQWHSAFLSLAMFAGREYWRAQAGRMAALHFQITVSELDHKALIAADALAERWDTKTATIRQAFTDLCELHGFDTGAMLKLADMPAKEISNGNTPPPDPDYLQELLELFNSLLPS
jgi:hypothetical protein